MLLEIEGRWVDPIEITGIYPVDPKGSVVPEGAFEHNKHTKVTVKDKTEFIVSKDTKVIAEEVRNARAVVEASAPKPPLVEENSLGRFVPSMDMSDVLKVMKQIVGNLDNIGQQLQRLVIGAEKGGIHVQLTNQIKGVDPPVG